MSFSNTHSGSVDQLLIAWRQGDVNSRNMLFDVLYNELTRLSAFCLQREGGVSLSAGDLVHEAAIRLVNLEQIEWQDKAHFLAISAQIMRRVLVDHARKKYADKRSHQKVTLLTNHSADNDRDDTFSLCLLDEALNKLADIDKTRAQIVEMRYFGGVSIEEIAAVIGASPSTIKRNWRASRAWLLSELDMQEQLPDAET
ncbi:ECF-type sigma factor [Aliiglaciecola lipolytica]|uniref:ECF sigma factor family protein n=1 Tax=Aliiglaciecola lipolytica E3 TaxID=1127673 RepID=K6Y428_9ALTE|nr:ECF-type sigma factor [Aliiglaciecola lipolytica]GAC13022.1 ECF sigma factor family protein [Aliiglaciecola lipolytica E3]